MNRVSSIPRGGWTLLLMAVFAAAFALRLKGIGFGLPALNDPDELMFELGALRMLRGLTLNPGWFGHPATTTMYVLAVVNTAVFLVGQLAGWFPTVGDFADAIYADPSWFILPGRIAMLLCALGTIWQTYRLGSELFDRGIGLAAAVLLAVNPLHVAYSQIIRSDMMACLLMLLCLRAALRIARKDAWRDYVLASFWLGLAIATKWPFAVSALGVAAAVGLRMANDPANRKRTMVRCVLFGAMGIGFLLLASPYILLDYPTVVRNLHGEAQLYHLGATGGTPWENAWWYLRGSILTGFGWAGMALLVFGSALLARRREALAIIAPVVIVFSLLICSQNLVWDRWVLPLMPLFAIIAALALARLGAIALSAMPRPVGGALMAGALAITLLPLGIAAQANGRIRLNDTRQQASVWARAHLPSGSTVLIEHFAFDLLPQPWHFLFPLGDAGCADVKAYLHGKVGYATIDASRGTRANVDYGTVAPDKRQTCRADYAILTQYDRYRVERQLFPTEYTAYQALLAQGEIMATFAPRPGESTGPIVRIVRFRN